MEVDKAAAIMKRDITGRVRISHLRRPRVSMVRIAGKPKAKFTAPIHKIVSLGQRFFVDRGGL